MTNASNIKQKYDLEERTANFAIKCRDFVKNLPRTVSNIEDGKQLIRSSGSVAANYIEASESLSKKDFILRIKICRKEAKESRLWLNLCDIKNSEEQKETRSSLIQEASELGRIFGAILEKSK